MDFIHVEGIVVGKKDIGEGDRIIELYTRRRGRISLYLFGIRKSKRRDKGGSELLTKGRYIYYEKQEKLTLTSFEVIDYYKDLKSDIDNLNIAYYILEVLKKILVDGKKDSEFYDQVVRILEYIDRSEDINKKYLLLPYFLMGILKKEGLIFNPLEDGDYLQLEDGKMTFKNTEIGIKIKEKTKDILSRIYTREEIDQGSYEKKDIVEVVRVLERYINYHLEIKLEYKDIF